MPAISKNEIFLTTLFQHVSTSIKYLYEKYVVSILIALKRTCLMILWHSIILMDSEIYSNNILNVFGRHRIQNNRITISP